MRSRTTGLLFLLAVWGWVGVCFVWHSPHVTASAASIDRFGHASEEVLSQASCCFPRFSQHTATEAAPQILARVKRATLIDDSVTDCDHGARRSLRHSDSDAIVHAGRAGQNGSLISLKVRLQV